MKIKFPVTVGAGPDEDIVKTTVKFQADGGEVNTVEITGNGGTTSIKVDPGSSGNVWFTYTDRKPQESTDSPKTRWENADDVTPPSAPAGAPVLGQGQLEE